MWLTPNWLLRLLPQQLHSNKLVRGSLKLVQQAGIKYQSWKVDCCCMGKGPVACQEPSDTFVGV